MPANSPPDPPALPESAPARLTVRAAFDITGRGVVLAGTIESGDFRPGQSVRVIGPNGTFDTTVRAIDLVCQVGVEPSRRRYDSIGLLLNGVRKDQFEEGQQVIGLD
ncbi:hypothetical protein ACWIGI_08285 [Nocardia sp. NPDC055321]